MTFKELVLKRRSIRVYEETDIPDTELKELIETALMAPSWRNLETGRYYLVKSKDMIDKIKASLPEFNQVRCRNAMLIVTAFEKNLSGYDKGEPCTECGNEWGAYDLGLQNAYLMLKAKDMGYDTLVMGLRDGDLIRRELGIPENYEIMPVLALGKGNQEPVNKERKKFEEVAKII